MPILGVIFALIDIVSRRQTNWFAFALSIAIIYAYMPMLWDAVNTYNIVYVYNLEFIPGHGIIKWISKEALLPFRAILFLIYLLTIFLLLRAIGPGLRQRHSKKSLILFLALLLCTVEYRFISDLFRTSLALAIAITGLVKCAGFQKYIMYGVAFAVHPFSLLLVALEVSAKFLILTPRRLIAAIAFLIFLVGTVVFPLLVTNLLQVAETLDPRLRVYASGEIESRFNSNLANLLNIGLISTASVSLSLFCLQHLRRQTSPDERRNTIILLLLCVFCLSTHSFPVVYERSFLTLVIVTAFVAPSVFGDRFWSPFSLVGASAIICLTVINSAFTIQLSHSPRYVLTDTPEQRVSKTLSGLFLPAPYSLMFSSPRMADVNI